MEAKQDSVKNNFSEFLKGAALDVKTRQFGMNRIQGAYYAELAMQAQICSEFEELKYKIASLIGNEKAQQCLETYAKEAQTQLGIKNSDFIRNKLQNKYRFISSGMLDSDITVDMYVKAWYMEESTRYTNCYTTWQEMIELTVTNMIADHHNKSYSELKYQNLKINKVPLFSSGNGRNRKEKRDLKFKRNTLGKEIF